MSHEAYQRAVELHQKAAHLHAAAAASHDKGEHLTAHELSRQAHEHPNHRQLRSANTPKERLSLVPLRQSHRA